MSDTCVKHSFETAVGVCRQCHNSYCAECLVYAFGENKPPYCVTCALNVAGIRHQGAKPNPRLRRKGLFRRKVMVDETPRVELGFDDVKIDLPDEAYSAPVMSRQTTPETAAEPFVAGDVDDTGVESPEPPTSSGGPTTVPLTEPGDSLAGWAESLAPAEEEPLPARRGAWPERATSSYGGWPDD